MDPRDEDENETATTKEGERVQTVKAELLTEGGTVMPLTAQVVTAEAPGAEGGGPGAQRGTQKTPRQAAAELRQHLAGLGASAEAAAEQLSRVGSAAAAVQQQLAELKAALERLKQGS